MPVLESQTASENADINVGVSTPAVIHFAYLGSINNIIDIDGIVNFLEITGKMIPVFLHVVGDGENRGLFEEKLKARALRQNFTVQCMKKQSKQRSSPDACLGSI